MVQGDTKGQGPRPPQGAGDISPRVEQGEIPLVKHYPTAGGKGRSAQQLTSAPLPFPVFTIRNHVGFLLAALYSFVFFPISPTGSNLDGAQAFRRSWEGWGQSGPAPEARREEGWCSNGRNIHSSSVCLGRSS